MTEIQGWLLLSGLWVLIWLSMKRAEYYWLSLMAALAAIGFWTLAALEHTS